jgi:hypothetical protein
MDSEGANPNNEDRGGQDPKEDAINNASALMAVNSHNRQAGPAKRWAGYL